MSKIDPENMEMQYLFQMVDLTNKHVLEIGCGDGRLTFRFAEKAAHVIAIDPGVELIELAKKNTADHLHGKVDFQAAGLDAFALESKPSIFDLVILSYSLC